MDYFKSLLKNKWFYIILGIIILSSFYPLPYYITQPGEARVLDPIIEVEGGYEDEGDFMLTTVLIGKANLAGVALAQFSEYYHIYPLEAIRHEGETDKEYNTRQLELMHSSQNAAVIVGFQAAGKEIEINNKGVLVTNLIDGMPAEEQLRTGDLIKKVGSTEIKTKEQLIKVLATYDKDDVVPMLIERGKETLNVEVGIAKFPDKFLTPETVNKYGIGISYPVTYQTIETNPDIEIETSDIGGPSAGLMFSLEIFNQLTDEDYTKGYKVAGTGTIDENGNVGPIGGIKQKVVAADNAEAEIFLAPVAGDNYKDAKEAAADIGTKMDIVPIETFKDAITYLEKLKEK